MPVSQGGISVPWLALLPNSRKILGLIFVLGPFGVEFACSVCSSGYYVFLPQSRDMHIRHIGDSKLSVGVNAYSPLYVSPCDELFQGVPCLHPNIAGTGSSIPAIQSAG